MIFGRLGHVGPMGPVGRATAEGWLTHLPYNFYHYLSYCFFSGTATLALFLKCHSRPLKKRLMITAPASEIAAKARDYCIFYRMA